MDRHGATHEDVQEGACAIEGLLRLASQSVLLFLANQYFLCPYNVCLFLADYLIHIEIFIIEVGLPDSWLHLTVGLSYFCSVSTDVRINF